MVLRVLNRRTFEERVLGKVQPSLESQHFFYEFDAVLKYRRLNFYPVLILVSNTKIPYDFGFGFK